MSFDRERLVGFAYGMLGSWASAEDVVQEAWLRLDSATDVRHPEAWMRTVVARLALDELKSARSRRESYLGPWLPEPAVEASIDPALFREALSLATLAVLERLGPAERCAYLLRELFDLDYAEIAALLESTEPAVRQVVSRSRKHLQAERPRFEPAADAHLVLLAALLRATATGDLEGLKELLAADVRFVSDGGGRVVAAVREVVGPDAVARLLIGLHRKLDPGTSLRPAVVNGSHGVVTLGPGGVSGATAFCVSGGRVTALYVVRNPDKLTRLRP